MASELIVPITEDLRKEDLRFDIIKGIENINVKDEPLVAGLDCEIGDWLVKGANGLEAPTSTPAANTYPVWSGNDQYDAKATGNATIIINGGFIYRTKKFVAGSYVEGQNLTVKADAIPEGAGAGDPVLARVYSAPNAAGVMEILVLNR